MNGALENNPVLIVAALLLLAVFGRMIRLMGE